MKLQFLGAAAAEGFPNLFCHCDACDKARRLGGRNIRSCTSVIIDDVLKVDYPPDSFSMCIETIFRSPASFSRREHVGSRWTNFCDAFYP